VSNVSIYELVRRDLLHREVTDRANFGTPTEVYTGDAALLDAYDSAIDLACYIRRIIENMTVGDGSFDKRETHQ
jgi:hypothetical protein